RPDIQSEKFYGKLVRQWLKFLHTPQSINEHVNVFDHDLCQLIEQLKKLVYLDIRGCISYGKIEPYRLRVQTRFPNSQIHISASRFRLWI
ncbi:unnamed protein product, partial [Rotaria sordida]